MQQGCPRETELGYPNRNMFETIAQSRSRFKARAQLSGTVWGTGLNCPTWGLILGVRNWERMCFALEVGGEEFLDGVEGNDVYLVIQVGVAGARDDEQLLIVRRDASFHLLVCALAEVAGMRLFTVND